MCVVIDTTLHNVQYTLKHNLSLNNDFKFQHSYSNGMEVLKFNL